LREPYEVLSRDIQDVTVSLSRQTLQKARVLAARRATSISKLLAAQIEALVGDDEAYQTLSLPKVPTM
jgi:hypothetical protein